MKKRITIGEVEKVRQGLRKEINSIRKRQRALDMLLNEKQTELAAFGGDPYFYLNP